MSQFTAKLPETKSEKCGALVWQPATDNEFSRLAGALLLKGKRSECRYAVEEYAADHGRGFMLFKMDAGSDKCEERYACLIGKHAKACECRGFAYAGHCKHTAALALLVEAGQL
jgi:hypothetical protein